MHPDASQQTHTYYGTNHDQVIETESSCERLPRTRSVGVLLLAAADRHTLMHNNVQHHTEQWTLLVQPTNTHVTSRHGCCARYMESCTRVEWHKLLEVTAAHNHNPSTQHSSPQEPQVQMSQLFFSA
jgi:hypothetical protein